MVVAVSPLSGGLRTPAVLVPPSGLKPNSHSTRYQSKRCLAIPMLDGGLRGKARFTHPTKNNPNALTPQPLGSPSPPGLWLGVLGAGGVRGKTARKAVWLFGCSPSTHKPISQPSIHRSALTSHNSGRHLYRFQESSPATLALAFPTPSRSYPKCFLLRES